MTRGKLAAAIDVIIERLDRDAVRRTGAAAAGREVSIWHTGDGMAGVYARLIGADATALDARLEKLAGSVCAADPRTPQQRRADALGALGAGADRLACRCGAPDCPADPPPPSPVVIQVIAEAASLSGASLKPGISAHGELIPAPLLAQLAATARQQPLAPPLPDAPPENRYIPSARLAEFIRARDLTCRAPGCDRPARDADIDHTVAYARGGPTHAGNLKCLCRPHHLLKTFWGWRDTQLPDGTVLWQLPGGHTYVTTPASALLFPSLSTPTGIPPVTKPAGAEPCGNREAMMPQRKRTRAQNRARYIATERQRNHTTRQQPQTDCQSSHSATPAAPAGDDPPPF